MNSDPLPNFFACTGKKVEPDLEQLGRKSIPRVSCVKSASSPWWRWSLFLKRKLQWFAVIQSPILWDKSSKFPHDPVPVFFFFFGCLWKIESPMLIGGDSCLIVWKRYLFYVLFTCCRLKPCGFFLKEDLGASWFFSVTFFAYASTRGE